MVTILFFRVRKSNNREVNKNIQYSTLMKKKIKVFNHDFSSTLLFKKKKNTLRSNLDLIEYIYTSHIMSYYIIQNIC